jgi:Vacuolar protein sorting-associated protein 62/Insecticidal Crystal Toxin, P42
MGEKTMRTLGARLRIAVFALLGAQAVITAGLAGAQDTSYQGLWWNSPAESESGWGINVAHQGDTIFATWFTYDATGDGWWLSMTANKIADRSYAGILIETGGPAFNAVPFDPTKVTRTVVGSGMLSFRDEDNGTFSYTVKGVSQTKSLTRQVFGPLPSCNYVSKPEFAATTNYQDLWWVAGGAESGWGINLTHQGDSIFATWFTYDADGTPLWLSVTAGRTAPRVYSGELIRTRGPAFNAVPFDPKLVTRTVVGNATFTFTNGSAGTFAYTVNGVTQTKTLARQLFSPPAGTMCAFGKLTFDRISLATFPGAQESITVAATNAIGGPDEWTVRSDNEAIAQVMKIGTRINVTGVGLGRTQLTVLSGAGVQRSVPVLVYDPKVLDVGEIEITYVDQFACRWTDAHAGADIHASFYHPVVPAGWHALGSLGVRDALDCPVVSNQRWMMLVRADPDDADPVTPPLDPPTGFTKEWDDTGTGGDVMYGAFWTPVCRTGYVAMGTVVTKGRATPPLSDATCVRKDLTRPAIATSTIWNDKGTGGDVAYQGSFTMEAPENFNFAAITAFLRTGTFVTQGQLRSCTTEGCWTPPTAHPVMNVLAVELPTLIDTPNAATLPRLTGYDRPAAESEPLMEKALLVPFTAVGSGEAYLKTRGLHWMVSNSPFVRTERVVRWGLEFWQYNSSSVEQNSSKTFTKGISVTDSNTFSVATGISITAEGGVEFMGIGGSVSATVSLQLGYESQHSVNEFREESTTVTLHVPPYKAAAFWREYSDLVVKLHNPVTYMLEPVITLPMADFTAYTNDEYPD